MNGRRYRVERTPTGWYIYDTTTSEQSLTTKQATVQEAEAMLHGLTLPQLVRDVRAFHERFKLPMPAKSTIAAKEDWTFRLAFLTEELDELFSAQYNARWADALDALVDLVYVAIGTAIWMGWDFEEAWRRVQRANMAKVRSPSADASKRGHALDVVKPEGWVAPDLSDLVK